MALLLLSVLFSCKKFLDEKPNVSYKVPDSLRDLQALLDYFSNLNVCDPAGGEVSNTDYYLTDANWSALSSEYYRRMYAWEGRNLFEPAANDWLNVYRAVYTANTVLDNLNGIETSDQIQLRNVHGQALFFRAKNFLQAAMIWSPAYDPNDPMPALGVPLRLNSDFNEVSVRSGVHETYEQVVRDLKAAAPLLPATQVTALRPSKAAAFGLLARTFLYMGRFTEAGAYADSALQLNNKLLDYNTLNPSATYPVPRFNAEVLFDSSIPTPAPVNPSRAKIVTELYNAYDVQDLRKIIFFRTNTDGTIAFKGSYEGGITFFSGIATDELYLTRAECLARSGKVNEALKDMDVLLSARWKGSYAPVTATTPGDALNLVLMERRKELLMRGLNWMDIKRLNREGRQVTLTRTINGNVLTMAPNSAKFALPIPEDVIALTGMPQNPN